jgi:hypothetical protein
VIIMPDGSLLQIGVHARKRRGHRDFLRLRSKE